MVDTLGPRVSDPRRRLAPSPSCLPGSLAWVMAGSRPGETCSRWGVAWTWGRALVPQKSGVQAGSCPALQGALGWSLAHLPGAAEKGTGTEEVLLERCGMRLAYLLIPQVFEDSLKDPEWTWTPASALLCHVGWRRSGMSCSLHVFPTLRLGSPGVFQLPVHLFSIPDLASNGFIDSRAPGVPDWRTELGAQLGPYWQVRTVE